MKEATAISSHLPEAYVGTKTEVEWLAAKMATAGVTVQIGRVEDGAA